MAAWRVLQIADSAFPAGGFAHSAGLEAALQLGEARTPERLEAYARMLLWNVGSSSLPFVRAAHDHPPEVWELDARVDSLLTNHVANRASRTQGRAFIATCSRSFDDAHLAALAARSRSREVTAHVAPLFGAALAVLSVTLADALALHLYLALRGAASAAVRLGIIGPYEAQGLVDRCTVTMDAVLERCADLRPAEAATTAPLLDVFGATHDRAYTRLFLS